MRSKTKTALIVTTLLAVGAVVSHILMPGSDAREVTPGLTDDPTIDPPVAHLPVDIAEDFQVAFSVQRSEQANSPPFVVADILVDDDFIDTNGANWQNDVGEMIRATNNLLGQVEVEIRIGSIGVWESEDEPESLSDLMDSAITQSQRDPSRLLIVITCQNPPKKDGLAQSGYGRVIVEYYHNDIPRNAALLSHEIGHLFGAGHHADAVECVGDGCLMDAKGYSHSENWCDHHRQLIGDATQAALALSDKSDPEPAATSNDNLQHPATGSVVGDDGTAL